MVWEGERVRWQCGAHVGNTGYNLIVNGAKLVGKLINRHCCLALLTDNNDLITHLDTAAQEP